MKRIYMAILRRRRYGQTQYYYIIAKTSSDNIQYINLPSAQTAIYNILYITHIQHSEPVYYTLRECECVCVCVYFKSLSAITWSARVCVCALAFECNFTSLSTPSSIVISASPVKTNRLKTFYRRRIHTHSRSISPLSHPTHGVRVCARISICERRVLVRYRYTRLYII